MKIDQELQAKVVDVLEDGSLIMSFDGKLYRVRNQSSKQYNNEEWLRLKIKKLRPLEFKILD